MKPFTYTHGCPCGASIDYDFTPSQPAPMCSNPDSPALGIMKTQNANCNPSVTITITCAEAMTIWHSLQRLERTHRKVPPHKPKPNKPQMNGGEWGHWDCPPEVQPLLAVIKGSIHAEHPEFFETMFGYKPEDYKPTVNAPT